MKDLNMLVWITQLGIGVAVPLAAFVALGLWLREKLQLGAWIVLVMCALGLICSINALRHSLKMMARMDQQRTRKKKQVPPVSFNEHE